MSLLQICDQKHVANITAGPSLFFTVIIVRPLAEGRLGLHSLGMFISLKTFKIVQRT